ncbi:MAG: hypothetical protein AABZ23_01345 [Deltaproteobacteria bacterium]
MRLRFLLVFFMALMLFSGTARSTDKKDSAFNRLRAAVSRVQKKSANSQSTAVAGVKGAPESATDELYWKDGANAMNEAQTNELAEILPLIEKGDREAAITRLDAFLKNHPESPVKGDIEEELKVLRSKE